MVRDEAGRQAVAHHTAAQEARGFKGASALALALALDPLFRQSALSKTRGVLWLSRALRSICLQKGLAARVCSILGVFVGVRSPGVVQFLTCGQSSTQRLWHGQRPLPRFSPPCFLRWGLSLNRAHGTAGELQLVPALPALHTPGRPYFVTTRDQNLGPSSCLHSKHFAKWAMS